MREKQQEIVTYSETSINFHFMNKTEKSSMFDDAAPKLD